MFLIQICEDWYAVYAQDPDIGLMCMCICHLGDSELNSFGSCLETLK